MEIIADSKNFSPKKNEFFNNDNTIANNIIKTEKTLKKNDKNNFS
jgi:hypothetical protein